MYRPLAALFVLLLLSLVLTGCNDDDPVVPGNEITGPAPYLEPEPPFTPGNDNTVSWTGAGGGQAATEQMEFLVQRASDPDFAGALEESDWVSDFSFTFSNLDHATTHHYRVRSRDARGIESAWSARRTSTQDAVPPVASVTGLAAEQKSLLFEFVLSATEETSGIREIELWFSLDGGDITLFGAFPPGEVRFQAAVGGPHEFYPLAVDGSGNRQELAPAPAGATLVPEPIILTDLKGEDFDITAAVLEYRMAVTYWEYGVGRYTIRPIIDPLMIGPGDVGYPLDTNTSEIVGIQFEDDVRAYLIGDIRNREVVDDVVNGMPVALCYCPLCDSYGVYNRVLDGEILTIAASGWTWHQIFVLQDYETGSLWFPGLSFPGQPDFLLCIAGPHQGRKLFAKPTHRTKWKPWKNAYPHSLIMKTK